MSTASSPLDIDGVCSTQRHPYRLAQWRLVVKSATIDSGPDGVFWPSHALPASFSAMGAATPFLLLDLDVVRDRYRALRAVLPDLELFYAIKCNPSAGVLLALHQLGGGFEIASLFELNLLAEVGVAAERVLYSNTVKPASHIAGARARGVDRFAVDSEAELQKIAAVAPGSSVYVRVTVEDGTSRFPLSRKFGVPVEVACRLLVSAAELGLRPYGLTFHVGSQCTDPHAWRRAIAQCAFAMTELRRRRIRLEMLDIGGGLPARYGDLVPPISDYAAIIGASLETLPYRPPLICAEPGRYLVAESGVLAASVIGVVDRGGERWAYLDVGGYNGLMETVQTGGRWQFPLRTSREDHATVPHQRFTVTGPSCDSSDTMFYNVMLPATLEEGDRVFIGCAGAYTSSYASSFNGFPPPAVLYTSTRDMSAVG